MSAQIKFNNYKLTDPQQKVLLETDFTSEVSVERGWWHRVLQDWMSFTNSKSVVEYISQLDLNVNTQAVKLERVQDTVTLTPAISGTPAEWFNQQLQVPQGQTGYLADIWGAAPVDKPTLLRVLPNMLTVFKSNDTSAAPMETPVQAALKTKIMELGGDQSKELLDLNSQIRALEQELATQRQIDDIELSSASLIQQISEIQEKLASVDQLAARQQQIETILTKYGPMLKGNLENEGLKLRSEISGLRLGELQTAASNSHKDSITIPKDEDAKQPRFLVTQIGAMSAITLLTSIVVFFILNDKRVIFLGAIFAVFQLLLLVALNLVPARIATESHEVIAATANLGGAAVDRSRIPVLEKFFVDKAWVNALSEELGSVKKSMQAKLGGNDYQKLKQLREVVESEFRTIRAELDSHKTKEIPPTEYIHKRRDLDTLKIKRSKLENAMSTEVNFNKITDLVDELNDSYSEPASSFISELSDSFVDLVVQNGELLTKTSLEGSAERVDVPENELLAIYMWLRLEAWSKSPTRPLVIVKDAVSQLSERAQNAINAKISQLQNLGQVITVTVQG